jgi:hypothetical protein
MLFEGQVTQEAIEKLVKHLDLVKDNYPTKAQSASRKEESDESDFMDELSKA